MPPDLAQLWQFLLERYTGAENGATRTAIFARYKILHNSELNDRAFRLQVADLVTLHKKPICASASGLYFVARTTAEKPKPKITWSRSFRQSPRASAP